MARLFSVLAKPVLSSGLAFSLATGGAPAALAASERVVYAFESKQPDGANPWGALINAQQALNEARRGEIIAAAIVFARPDEDKCSGVSAAPGGDMHYLIAACDYLKRDIIAKTDN